MAKWFYLNDGQPTGPIEPAALKQLATSGRLKPTDKVRREDMAEWIHANQVKGLFPSSSPTAPPQSPIAGKLRVHSIEPPEPDNKSKSSRASRLVKTFLLSAACVLFGLVAGIILQNARKSASPEKESPVKAVTANEKPTQFAKTSTSNEGPANSVQADAVESSAAAAPSEGHKDFVESVAFRPDERQVLTGSMDNTAILWDTATGRKLRVFDVGDAVTSVAFSPDGRKVLIGAFDNTATLWDATNGRKLRTFEGHSQEVNAVAFSRDGRQVVTGSSDGNAILWDAEGGKKSKTFDAHATGVKVNAVMAVAFSPDGHRVLTGSTHNTAILWDAASGEKLRTFEEVFFAVNSVAFSPDGRQVLVGSVDKTASLWDAATGRKLRTFDGHTGVFSPDGRQVLTLTSKTDAAAILWDSATGENLRTFKGQFVSSAAAFSPDGHQVLTAMGNAAILWDAGNGEKLKTFGAP